MEPSSIQISQNSQSLHCWANRYWRSPCNGNAWAWKGSAGRALGGRISSLLLRRLGCLWILLTGLESRIRDLAGCTGLFCSWSFLLSCSSMRRMFIRVYLEEWKACLSKCTHKLDRRSRRPRKWTSLSSFLLSSAFASWFLLDSFEDSQSLRGIVGQLAFWQPLLLLPCCFFTCIL